MKIRIYYEDTDYGKVVYYANYLKYMERGRTEYMRERNISLADFHEKGYIFAVADVHAKYRKPAKYNDLLDVITELIELTSITMLFKTTIYNQNNIKLVEGTAKLVCIDENSGKACKAPKEMMKILNKDLVS